LAGLRFMARRARHLTSAGIGLAVAAAFSAGPWGCGGREEPAGPRAPAGEAAGTDSVLLTGGGAAGAGSISDARGAAASSGPVLRIGGVASGTDSVLRAWAAEASTESVLAPGKKAASTESALRTRGKPSANVTVKERYEALDKAVDIEIRTGEVAEARKWLRAPKHMLFGGDKQILTKYVDDLYDKGATKVHVLGLFWIEEVQMTVGIAAALPDAPRARQALFDLQKKYLAEYGQGEKEAPEVGQKYIVVLFD